MSTFDRIMADVECRRQKRIAECQAIYDGDEGAYDADMTATDERIQQLETINADLLAACETLLAAGESGLMSEWYPAAEKARAAIAKARSNDAT